MNNSAPILQQFKTKEEQDNFFDQYLPELDPDFCKFVRTLKSIYSKVIDKLTLVRRLIAIFTSLGLICCMILIFGCAGSYDLGIETQETQRILIESIVCSLVNIGLIVFNETYVRTKINEFVNKYNYCLELIDALKTIKR